MTYRIHTEKRKRAGPRDHGLEAVITAGEEGARYEVGRIIGPTAATAREQWQEHVEAIRRALVKMEENHEND